MRKLVWYLKQLLPLTYYSTCEEANGEKYILVRKMWLRKIQWHKKYQILVDTDGIYEAWKKLPFIELKKQ